VANSSADLIVRGDRRLRGEPLLCAEGWNGRETAKRVHSSSNGSFSQDRTFARHALNVRVWSIPAINRGYQTSGFDH
jgi:hypothetical protein